MSDLTPVMAGAPPLPKLYAAQDWSSPEEQGEAVSVIMRTKDRPLLLPRALRSVLGQSFHDWRLYLVNDGGDGPALEASLAPYLEAFGDRLRVIRHAEARGMEAASNAGLAMARGVFFAIHDDDDGWHEDFLSQTVAFLRDPAHRAAVGVATGCEVVRERIEGEDVVTLARFPWVYFQPPVELGAMLVRNQMPPITLLLRRALLARIGDYNEALPVLGDWEFILRVLAVGDIGAIAAPLAYYHHRVEAGQSVYANSVSAGLNIHRETKAVLGNQIIRTALAADPALLGLLWPVLQAIEAVAERRQALEKAVEASAGRQAELAQAVAQCQVALAAAAAAAATATAEAAAMQADAAQRLAAIETHVLPGIEAHLTRIETHLVTLSQIAEQQNRLLAPLRWLNRQVRGGRSRTLR